MLMTSFRPENQIIFQPNELCFDSSFLLVVGIYAEPSENNPRHFFVKIAGPGDTPYEGGLFQAELFLPDEYPMVPPKVLFRTKIFHPNIDKLGKLKAFTPFLIKTKFFRKLLREKWFLKSDSDI